MVVFPATLQNSCDRAPDGSVPGVSKESLCRLSWFCEDNYCGGLLRPADNLLGAIRSYELSTVSPRLASNCFALCTISPLLSPKRSQSLAKARTSWSRPSSRQVLQAIPARTPKRTRLVSSPPSLIEEKRSCVFRSPCRIARHPKTSQASWCTPAPIRRRQPLRDDLATKSARESARMSANKGFRDASHDRIYVAAGWPGLWFVLKIGDSLEYLRPEMQYPWAGPPSLLLSIPI